MSTRDSRLLEQLAPLLAGNCRTFLLACVSQRAEDYLDSLNTLRIASRARGIKVGLFVVLSSSDLQLSLFSKVQGAGRVPRCRQLWHGCHAALL